MFDGHEETLRRLLDGGRLSHAYIIAGPGGDRFADRLAAALVCEGKKKPCGQCAHCKKTALGIHPDIITLAPEAGKREILVDQIRQLRADAYIRPNEAEKKVYVIRPASALNANAQNALLKILEEGPAYAAFLLVTDTPGTLLSTVRSRCGEIILFGGEENRADRDGRAEELAKYLTGGDEYGLLTYCVGLEKLSREEMTRLLEDTVSVLEESIKNDLPSGAGIMPLIETLKFLWDAAQVNTGVGHLAGWLCAAAFQTRRNL